MIESRSRTAWLPHLVLALGVAVFVFPIYMALIGSTHDAGIIGRGNLPLTPGGLATENYAQAWSQGSGIRVKAPPVSRMLLNSLVMAVIVAVGKIAVSVLSAYAVVFFHFPGRMFFFWMIFVTLMLPVPVRLVSTYEIVGTLGWLNSYQGLTIPLMASATATFLFRQFYMTIPNELAEAAQIDGAGPLRFLWSFLLPLSWANIAALFVVLFIYGWNEYFWPLLITNTESMRTVVIGLERLIPRSGTEQPTWNLIMAGAMMALLPPVAVIVFLQRWFVKGLVESEK